jgi:hypothetical protein
MKQFLTFFVVATLCLCSCAQLDKGDPKTKAYVSGDQIFLSPFTPQDRPTFENHKNYLLLNFDKNGGQATVIAYFPEEDGVFLNEFFEVFFEWGIIDVPRQNPYLIDDQVSIKRTKLDDFSSEYVITVNPNRLGFDYDYFISLYDGTKVRNEKGTPLASKAVITLHQTVN